MASSSKAGRKKWSKVQYGLKDTKGDLWVASLCGYYEDIRERKRDWEIKYAPNKFRIKKYSVEEL